MTPVAEAFTAWSKSGLGDLTDGCAHRVYLKKVVGLPDPGSPATVLGTAYHAALEYHERVRILNVRDGAGLDLPTPDGLYQHVERDLTFAALELPDEMWGRHETSIPELHESLLAALANWWSAPIPDGQRHAGMSLRDHLMTMRPVAVEPYFRVPYGPSPRPLHGYIDWLGWDSDQEQWVVVDHKSANSFRRWPHGGEGHELEGATYTVGATIAANLPVKGDVIQEWHIARTREGKNARFEPVRLVSSRPGAGEASFLRDTMLVADRMVERGEWPKSPTWNLCSPKWCPFHVETGGPCNPDE